MALSFASSTRFSKLQKGAWFSGSSYAPQVTVRCCETTKEPPRPNSKLQVGSPIIVVEAPKVIKTAASMPCLRANAGLVKPGDVGRIVSRKPKDLWAVRLSIGTYLLDGEKIFARAHVRVLDPYGEDHVTKEFKEWHIKPN